MNQRNVILSSMSSTRKSLEAIRNGDAGLNERRNSILARVPNSNDWAAFEYETIRIKDLAYLSSATHHEFALLRGKAKDIIFHGTELRCEFNEELLTLLKNHKLRLIAHTHPDYGPIEPSAADRYFLRCIGQKKSVIISYITGCQMEFSNNMFEDFMEGGDNEYVNYYGS